MTRTFAYILTAAIALGAAAPAFAEHGGPHGGPRHGGPGGPRFFEKADTNKDGFLTKEEMRAAQEKKLDEMFANVDTDKDGKLSKEELKKGHEAFRAKMKARFEKMKEEKEKAAE